MNIQIFLGLITQYLKTTQSMMLITILSYTMQSKRKSHQ